MSFPCDLSPPPTPSPRSCQQAKLHLLTTDPIMAWDLKCSHHHFLCSPSACSVGFLGPEGKEKMETPKSTQTLVSFLNLEAAPKMARGVSNPFKRTGAVRGADQSLALSFLNPNLLGSEHVCPSAIWSPSGCHKGTSSDWEKPRGQWFPLAPQQEDGLMAGLPPCHKTHDRRTSWTEAWSRSALQCLLLTRGWERPGPAQATSRPQPG